MDYTYDAWARLKTSLTTGSTQFAQWGLKWAYDRYGNRTNQTVTHGSGPSSSLGISTSTNRITDSGYTYDSSGNLTNDGLNALVYDGENRVTSSTQSGATANYAYDGGGLRIKKVSGSTTTIYIFSGTKVIAEYENGAAPNSPTREYLYSGSQLLASIEGSTTRYHLKDHLSTRVIANTSGSILAEQGQHPFGESWYSTGTSGTPGKWKFTSYERDSESDNDYAMARFHVSRLGRFNSPDPIGGSVIDPQSQNRYAYVRNDPCSLVDPLGLESCTFNVAISNEVGFSAELVKAIEDRIVSIFERVKGLNGETVSVQFSFSGNADTTLGIQNSGCNLFGLGCGRLGASSQGDGPWPPRVFVGMIPGSIRNWPSNIGGVAAHELVHKLGNIGDLSMDDVGFSLMAFNSMDASTRQWAYEDPEAPMWYLTKEQVSQLFARCRKRHLVFRPGGSRIDIELVPFVNSSTEGNSLVFRSLFEAWGMIPGSGRFYGNLELVTSRIVR